MATISELQSRLEAIKGARDAGVLIVQHADSKTQFRSLDEMERIISSLESEIAEASGDTPPSRKVRYIEQRSRGL